MKKIIGFLVTLFGLTALTFAGPLATVNVQLTISGADASAVEEISKSLKNSFSQYTSTEFVNGNGDFTISGAILGYSASATACRVNVKMTDSAGAVVGTFAGPVSMAELKGDGFGVKLANKFGPSMKNVKYSATPKSRSQWIAELTPPAPKPASVASNTTGSSTASKIAPAPSPSRPAPTPAPLKVRSPAQYLTDAANHESKGNYVNAMICFCNAGTVDPWNATAIDGIKRVSKNLASGRWGNNNYGADVSDPYKIYETWQKMELEYQRFLSAAPRFTLTYNSTAKPEKQSTLERERECVRFVVNNFSFKDDYIAAENVRDAFDRLANSSFPLAASVQKFERNNSTIKIAPESPSSSEKLGSEFYSGTIDAFEERSNSGNMTGKEVVGMLWGTGKNLVKTMRKGFLAYEAPLPKMNEIKELYWYGWCPSVRIAVADKNGNLISDWIWWTTGGKPEIYVPFDKYLYADHFVVSDQWRMVYLPSMGTSEGITVAIGKIMLNSITLGAGFLLGDTVYYIDDYYTPQKSQIIIKK